MTLIHGTNCLRTCVCVLVPHADEPDANTLATTTEAPTDLCAEAIAALLSLRAVARQCVNLSFILSVMVGGVSGIMEDVRAEIRQTDMTGEGAGL